MMDRNEEKIVLYTSSYCGHAISVERFLEQYEIPVEVLNIDRNADARARLIEINKGFASVPTLVFPDGAKMTEPPLRQLKERLGIEEDGLTGKLRDFLK